MTNLHRIVTDVAFICETKDSFQKMSDAVESILMNIQKTIRQPGCVVFEMWYGENIEVCTLNHFFGRCGKRYQAIFVEDTLCQDESLRKLVGCHLIRPMSTASQIDVSGIALASFHIGSGEPFDQMPRPVFESFTFICKSFRKVRSLEKNDRCRPGCCIEMERSWIRVVFDRKS